MRPSLFNAQQTKSRRRNPACLAEGFSLVELLLALSLGMVFSGMALQALVGEGQNTQRFTRLLREREHQRRTFELIRADLERAVHLPPTPGDPAPACGQAGRSTVLAFSTPEGTIVYTVGASPSGIWQRQVLMRCGPAYDLHGRVSAGTAFQNRVVIDGLEGDASPWPTCDAQRGDQVLYGSDALPFSVCLEPGTQMLKLRLRQGFAARDGHTQVISTEAVAAAG